MSEETELAGAISSAGLHVFIVLALLVALVYAFFQLDPKARVVAHLWVYRFKARWGHLLGASSSGAYTKVTTLAEPAVDGADNDLARGRSASVQRFGNNSSSVGTASTSRTKAPGNAKRSTAKPASRTKVDRTREVDAEGAKHQRSSASRQKQTRAPPRERQELPPSRSSRATIALQDESSDGEGNVV